MQFAKWFQSLMSGMSGEELDNSPIPKESGPVIWARYPGKVVGPAGAVPEMRIFRAQESRHEVQHFLPGIPHSWLEITGSGGIGLSERCPHAAGERLPSGAVPGRVLLQVRAGWSRVQAGSQSS